MPIAYFASKTYPGIWVTLIWAQNISFKAGKIALGTSGSGR
jgi:hypothetical protein